MTILQDIFMICTLTCYSLAKESDSVQFKPKDYTPSKPMRSNTYAPKTYAPKPHTPSAQLNSKPEEHKIFTDRKSLADKTVEPSTSFAGKSADKQTGVDGKTYAPGESDFPSTISNDKSFASQEKKMFLVTTNNSPFMITERPKERNPLLEPRQGIKAPEETTPTKDPSK